MQILTSIQPQIKAANLIRAGQVLTTNFQHGRVITASYIRQVMNDSCGGSDTDGVWQWKDAYEAIEVALILHLKTRSTANQSSQDILFKLQQIEKLCPTHTKRTQKSIELQQFSTPIGLSYIAKIAANTSDRDVVLEPSAGTGMLAVYHHSCQQLILNEIDPLRAEILKLLYSNAVISSHNAEQINDRLDLKLKPTVVVMNPPFSSYLNQTAKNSTAVIDHLVSALKRLQPNGRLVAISQESIRPNSHRWHRQFVEIQQQAKVVFSCGIAGSVYKKQGTSVETRLTVIDKAPASNPEQFCSVLPPLTLEAIAEHIAKLPPRVTTMNQQTKKKVKHKFTPGQISLFDLSSIAKIPSVVPKVSQNLLEKIPVQQNLQIATKVKAKWNDIAEIEYIPEYISQRDRAEVEGTGLYEAYATSGIKVVAAKSHPTDLVESLAMGSIDSPSCSYRPSLPTNLVRQGILSEPQLETIIRAGEAHQQLLNKWVLIDPTNGKAIHLPYAETNAKQERRGFLLGDGTGCGKGRQVAGIILDNWLKEKTKALWISVSDKLIEDARRDWCDLGGEEGDLFKQGRYKPNQKILHQKGILFTTYATIRRAATKSCRSRIDRIVEWLGEDFDGVIAFDECHAMGGAMKEKGMRGTKEASQQGLAGLELQNRLPNARIVYVSATGASRVQNLAYAERLGLWGDRNCAFGNREEFIEQINNSGLAGMELISRDLKAQGLYLARSLSYQGIQYQTLEHELTPEQVDIYNRYAAAYEIIHQNIEAALKAANATGGQARCAAMSAFESIKQRFFNQLLISMTCPTLIKALEKDLLAGYAPVIQIVSTNESMLEKTLTEIPVEEWDDLNIDISPKRYILEYLNKSFPLHLMEAHEVDGSIHYYYATDENGERIINQEAWQLKEQMLIEIMKLPAVHTALDQILFYFGAEKVAEVTGRSHRLLRYEDETGEKIGVKRRSASANLTETKAFMDDVKQILIFSKAGGTGRSYHASVDVPNQRQRIHYLLEAGWNAAEAIQGFGRTHRSNQKQPPIYRLVTTNVKGQKRFTSTIAARLNTLGAITKGQAETGSTGIFKAEDNLESDYAKVALTQLLTHLHQGILPIISLAEFEEKTGLNLTYEGRLRKTPTISQFMNRLLALPVDLQNYLFEAWETRIVNNIEEAKASGQYEQGMETIRGDSIQLNERIELWQDPKTKQKTYTNHIIQKDRIDYLTAKDALLQASNDGLYYNPRTEEVAFSTSTFSKVNAKTGASVERIRLTRPSYNTKEEIPKFQESVWQRIDRDEFVRLWRLKVKQLPEYLEKQYYIISGLLLPIWDRLNNSNLKVWRVVTDDGEAILGRVVPNNQIQSVYREFNQDCDYTPSQMLQSVEAGNTVKLVNGLRLKLSKVMHDYRIEIVGWNQNQYDRLISLGCFNEVISWQVRLFLPKQREKAVTILEQLL